MSNELNMRNNKSGDEGFDPSANNIERKSSASGASKFVWYFLFLLIIPLFIHIATRNSIKSQQESINQQASGIEVQLQKRGDTLVKLVDAVKSYVSYEKSFITEVTSMRQSPTTDISKMEESQSSVFGKLIAVAENYPETKADKAVQELMEQSSYLEREIAAARRLYNKEVTSFNMKLASWPSNVAAAELSVTTQPLFKASKKAKEDVKVSF